MRGLKPVGERRTDALAKLDWRQVERLLGALYAAQGYDVEACGTASTDAVFDGGVDLRLRRGDERIVMQVKHWNARKVPHNDVHQLLGVMVNEGATGAILVSSGEFTDAAVAAANRQGHVQLVDGDALRRMLVDAGIALPAAPPPLPSRASDFVDAMSAPVSHREPLSVRRHGPPPSRMPLIVMLAFVALCGVVFVLLIRGVLEKTKWTAGSSADETVRVESATRIGGEAERDAPANLVVRAPGMPTGCDTQTQSESGIHVDGCASGVAPSLNEAELRRESQRADDAARVIAGSTPEL